MTFPAINASVVEEGVVLSFSYHPQLVEYVRTIPGRQYDKLKHNWVIPKAQYRKFKTAYPRWAALHGCQLEFTITPEPGYEQALEELCNISFTPLPNVEGFKGTLYPFQADGTGFLVSRRHCLLADDMGLGKSIQTIAAALEQRNRGKIKKALIFVPKSIISQWVNEIEKFSGEKAIYIAGDKAQRALALTEAEQPSSFFIVTNYETILRDTEALARLKPDLVVLDEAQRVGSYQAKTTELIKRHFKSPYRWALSGTPLENALSEVHSIMDWIDDGVLGPWWIFRNEYLIYGGFKGKQIVGSRNLVQLHEQISPFMLRRRKAGVLKDLPAVTINTYEVDLDKDEWDLYKVLRQKLYEHCERLRKAQKPDAEEVASRASGEMLSALVYLRECCDHTALVSEELRKSSKLAELKNILQDLGDQKVVIFTEFAECLKLIAQALPMKYVTLYGAMDDTSRIRAINSFVNQLDVRVFLSTEAGGVGLNLQVASTIINYDLPWNPAKLQQRVGRLHRIGQKNTVTCINLLAKNTIEEHVVDVLNEKTALFTKVIDGNFDGYTEQTLLWDILRHEFPENQRMEKCF